MHKVLVNHAYRKGTKTPTKVLRVWAAFALSTDAEQFADQLRRSNPMWTVIVRIKW